MLLLLAYFNVFLMASKFILPTSLAVGVESSHPTHHRPRPRDGYLSTPVPRERQHLMTFRP